MWGVEPASDWRPWEGDLPPEIRVAASFSGADLAVLVGSGAAGNRGRYGVVGLPRRVRVLEPGVHSVRSAVDEAAGRLRVLVLGYELGAPCVFLEPRAPPRGQPAGLVLDLDAALLVDHAEQRVAAFGPDRARAAELLASLDRPVQLPCAAELELTPAIDDREHARRIRVAQEYIAAGDIYQANITRRLHVRGMPEAVAALAALSADNPVAHGAYVRAGSVELLSNSMETLVTYDPHSRTARSLPIKGTRRRDQDAESP
jgi:anthranilate/para-aminobenzoate synthase component I